MRPIIMTATALLALAGCGGRTTAEGERGNAGGTAADAGQGNAAGAAQAPMTSPDGRSEVRSDADFSGLPEGIPAYPRVSGAGAVQFGGAAEEGEMRVMGFRTADPPAAVVAFYAEAAQRAGFREIHRLRSGPSEVLGLERGNGDVMNVTATAAAGATGVQIMAGRGRGRR
ncbi:MAG: hypothetical protein QOD42_2705 [Sphingomonadales bacterium]|jgi:hypothetical protein|nr:hypothetical protein [Sphingomonadales bacterium]